MNQEQRRAKAREYMRRRAAEGRGYKRKLPRHPRCVVCGMGFERKTNAVTCGPRCSAILRRTDHDRRRAEAMFRREVGPTVRDKRNAKHQRKPPRTKRCERCGAEFVVRSSRKYCGDECSRAVAQDKKNARRREQYAADPEVRTAIAAQNRRYITAHPDVRKRVASRYAKRVMAKIKSDPATHRLYLAKQRDQKNLAVRNDAVRKLQIGLEKKLEST